jgi:hypothetical protein
MSDLNQYIPNLGKSGGPTISSSDMNQNLVQYISVPVTSAQITALNITPITLIPNPGTGNAIVVTDVVLDINGGTAYTAGGTVGVYYGLGTTGFIAGAVNTAFTSTTGSTVYFAALGTGIQVIPGTAVCLAQSSSTAFATGNESATVSLYYSVIPTGH